MHKLQVFVSILVVLFCGLSYSPARIAAQDSTQYQVNGSIYTHSSLENTTYIGGDFTQIQLADSQILERHNLAAYNSTTGVFSNWSPRVNGPVYTITSNYTVVYIGGEFTEVNGQPRRNVAAFDRKTGELIDWQLDIDSSVYSLTLDGSDLYLGGAFTKVNGQDIRYLTIYDTERKEIAAWGPNINGTVRTVSVDNLTVYVGGDFTEINGQERKYIASFDKSTGELTGWSQELSKPVYKINLKNNTVNIADHPEDDTQYVTSFTVTDVSAPAVVVVTPTVIPSAFPSNSTDGKVMINMSQLGFRIPTLSDVMTFVIRGFFVVAGLVALFYLLLGAFAWITSGGDKDAVGAARDKIQSAIVGVIMVVAILAIVVTLEQVVFAKRLCFGLSCPASIPALIQPTGPTPTPTR